jgi:hypothetical protein
VIYGTARPGTEVIIDGVPVEVRGDGTFDVRFSLPPPGTSGDPGTPAPRGPEASGAARKEGEG